MLMFAVTWGILGRMNKCSAETIQHAVYDVTHLQENQMSVCESRGQIKKKT
jgi:hypothetical protein